MQAAVQVTYGPPEVLALEEVERPSCRAGEVLVEVRASPVTYGDRRMRAADFPSFTWLPGRLMLGVFRPKNRPGTFFAGRVVEVGAGVSSFATGDDVFGFAGHSAYAEYVTIAADGPVAKLPPGLDYEAAADLPYGAVTALVYLRDLARVRPGEQVLIVGASGGVGRMAVQIAKHLGAEVTGACSADSAALVRSLGADHVLDYATEDFTRGSRRYDVIFDTAGTTTFREGKVALTPTGRQLFLGISLEILFQTLVWTRLWRGRTAQWTVVMPVRAHLDTISEMVANGALRPVLDQTFPLERIVEAHQHAERGRPRGGVLVTIGGRIQPGTTRGGRVGRVDE